MTLGPGGISMGFMRWFYELIQSLTLPILSPVLSTRLRPKQQWKRRLYYSVISGLLSGGLCLPVLAWSGDLSGTRQVEFQNTQMAMPVTQPSMRPIVAAGFGFQNADSSTITVKTYDALTGEVLSDESYDLNVKEEGASSSRQPRERIFAGGVGVGADGLSDFTLRVYDAATGRFLWEGRLNLAANDNGTGSTYRIVAHLQPKSSMRTVQQVERANGQPSFLLRATDPATGQLVWADQFSAGHGSVPRIERISESFAAQAQIPAARSKNFDFRIRMFDNQDRQMLWEDAVVPGEETEDLSLGHEGETDLLPAWSKGQISTRKDSIRLEELLQSVERVIRTATL
jgi:hypothetical protein